MVGEAECAKDKIVRDRALALEARRWLADLPMKPHDMDTIPLPRLGTASRTNARKSKASKFRR